MCLESKNDLVVKKDLICQDDKRNKIIDNINNPSINKEDDDNLNIIDNILKKK